MVDYNKQADLLKVMAHPVRLQILDLLRQGEVCVCHIEREVNKRQAYISQQLMVLRNAGLVESRRDSLQVFYTLTDTALTALLETLCGDASEAHRCIAGCPCPHCTAQTTKGTQDL